MIDKVKKLIQEGIDVNEKKGIITAVDVNSDESIVQFKF